MKSETWKRKIVKACQEAGTYRSFFEIPIGTLASILETRDKALEQYIKSGGNPVISYTNKAKQKNLIKNPTLLMVDELNKTALAYWRDLGLTPAGLKRISEEAMKVKKKSALAEALNAI